jgi:hypothetical protein
MSKDIAKILEGWQYEVGEVAVRIIPGDDGRDKIQLRVDMGLLQMEIDGRPDGLRPEDAVSWLDYYVEKQQIHDTAHPDSTPFELSDEDCFRLWREGVQYYHRYLSFWHLKMYDLCVRDTERNLSLFAFVRAHAGEDRQRWQFEQWRPYVLMMHARAVATPMVEKGDLADALRAIDSGIELLREFLDTYDQSERSEQCAELVNLEQWREEVLVAAHQAGQAEPYSSVEILRRRLSEAVAEERFEDAAALRDQIRRMSQEEGLGIGD